MSVMWLRDFLRSIVYPGLDIHLRNRASLSQNWRSGARTVLDAGSGNGYFAWRAYQSGASVVALNFDRQQAERAERFLVGYRGADPKRLRFEVRNLYDLASETRRFDEIICYEVLEHMRRDREVVADFFRLLNPGGALHLCCPNADHPRHRREVLDTREAGGHVRPGYTLADYRALLEPVGFEIDVMAGIGPLSLYLADEFLRWIRNRAGDWAALPFFPFALPFVWFASMDPEMPFSLYVRARKPTANAR
ncbi:MAG: methyltransferase domain-containing protein [Burkholderiales bacterium]|nr:methyltransferase domain-containing protein [Burkholderiales bacterium]